MALIVKDRVRETTTTTGTGTITLLGPVAGFQSFSVIGNSNTTYYSIVDVATGSWEVGIGTYTSSGTTLSRTIVLESSNAGALVNFGSGTKDVFCTYPADRSVSQADVGTAPNQLPLNQYLGSMAYQDRTGVNIGGGVATLGTATITSIQNDTAISNVEPSLMLNFAAVEALDPRITYSRASTATYYNGVTTAKAEENLLLQSQTFEISPWGVANGGTGIVPVRTSNHGIAPDGTTTADRIEFSLNGGTAIGDLSQLVQNVTTISGLPYVFSMWVKSTDGTSTYSMQLGGASASDNITVTGTWTRFTAISNAVGSSVSFQIRLRGGQTPTNSNTADIQVWGAQVEQRSAATAYTVTTTQPITNYIPVLLTAASGVPRFDHNPISQESLGFLVEEQRTNLVLQSENFGTTWANTNTNEDLNIAIAPNGTLTAAKLYSTAGNDGYISQAVNLVSATVYTSTVYAKAAGFTSFRIIQTASGGDRSATFTLTGDGSTSSVSAGATATIVSVGNGVYRCGITYTATSTGATGFRIYPQQFGATGDGYSGIFIWGAQLEAGSFPTSYIATVASQVTRAADAASMTGTNFSSWYSQGEGTLYVESLAQDTSAANNKNLRLHDGVSTSNEIWLGSGSPGTSARCQIISSNVTYFDSNLPSQVTANVFGKYAVSFETNNAVLCANGTLGTVDTAVVISSAINQFTILPPSQRAGYYKKISYFPRKLSDAELQEMTS
jgi:hypothetical protein